MQVLLRTALPGHHGLIGGRSRRLRAEGVLRQLLRNKATKTKCRSSSERKKRLQPVVLLLPEVAEENAGRVTAAAAVVVETAVEGFGSTVRADPVLKLAGMTVGAPSWAAVIVAGPAAVVRVPVAEEAALDRKMVASIRAAPLAGPETDPVTEGDPGTGCREVVLTVTEESGSMAAGPEGGRGGPEVARKGARSGHGEDQGVAGSKGAERPLQWRAAGGMETAGGLREVSGPVVRSRRLGSDHNHLGHAVHSSSMEKTQQETVHQLASKLF